MERVLVIGSPGAGKTTLSRRLAEKWGLPLIHLDKLYWRDNWQPAPYEEFEARLLEAAARPAWILDGNYSRTLPLRLERCDTVIYLDYPRAVCLWGVLRRVAAGYGRTRPDMGVGCPERLDWDFLKYVWRFPKNQRRKLFSLLDGQEGKTVVVLRSRRETARWLEGLAT
ncbi:MAG TPA: topology modulation protein [Firmicutes bacterium]|nr:topology modulation protein [Bacillota bacterium]